MTATIEITDSAKAYLDAFRDDITADTNDVEPATYTQAIKRLQDRSWHAAHGGGKDTVAADETFHRDIEDEWGETDVPHHPRTPVDEDESTDTNTTGDSATEATQ